VRERDAVQSSELLRGSVSVRIWWWVYHYCLLNCFCWLVRPRGHLHVI